MHKRIKAHEHSIIKETMNEDEFKYYSMITKLYEAIDSYCYGKYSHIDDDIREFTNYVLFMHNEIEWLLVEKLQSAGLEAPILFSQIIEKCDKHDLLSAPLHKSLVNVNLSRNDLAHGRISTVKRSKYSEAKKQYQVLKDMIAVIKQLSSTQESTN